MQLESWHKPEEIFAHAVILASQRSGVDLEGFEKKRMELSLKYKAEILPVNIPSLEISSAEIRRRLKDGGTVRYLLPEKVYAYICENRLYQEM